MGSNNEEWRTLSARVLEDEHDRYSELAKLRGMTLSAFVRETMQVLYPKELFEEQRTNLKESVEAEMLPTPEVENPRPPPQHPPEREAAASVMGFGALSDDSVLNLEDGLNAAFAAMDEHEAGRAVMGTAHGASPHAGGPNGAPLGMYMPGGPPVRNEEHPCRHLNIVPPIGFTRADCQGACTGQSGRPCHWPANVATQCGVYRPKASGPHKGIG